MAMENITSYAVRGLLQLNGQAFKVAVRCKGNRVNVQRPRPPHYARAKIEHLVRPKFFEKGERDSWFVPRASQCLKEEELALIKNKVKEDNPYERLLANDLKKWFMESKLIAFFQANPIKFDDRFDAEVRLHKEGMFLKKYGRNTVNMALEGTQYISVMPLFVSHVEMVFCSEPKVDKLLKVATKMPYHVLLAAIVEDRLVSVSQLRTLGLVKDLTTARAQLVGVLNAAQSQLVSGLTHHQSSLVYGLQQYAEEQQTPTNSTPVEETSSPPPEPSPS